MQTYSPPVGDVEAGQNLRGSTSFIFGKKNVLNSKISIERRGYPVFPSVNKSKTIKCHNIFRLSTYIYNPFVNFQPAFNEKDATLVLRGVSTGSFYVKFMPFFEDFKYIVRVIQRCKSCATSPWRNNML